MRFLLIPFALLMNGCAAIKEIQDNAETIFGGMIEAATGVGAAEAVVEAVTNPTVLSLTEAVLASVAVVTGGIGAYVGHKRGKKKKAKSRG